MTEHDEQQRQDARNAALQFARQQKIDQDERTHIADRVRMLLTDVRKGEVFLLAEKLQLIAELLERPGWHKEAEE